MDVIMPQLGETVTEGVVTKWHKKVGDAVKADEMLFDVETDKVSTEIPAPVAGIIAEILVQEGVTAKVGAALAVIKESGATAAVPVAAKTAASAAAVPVAAASVPRVAPAKAGERLSPAVRRLIAEHQLNPADIKGTGQDGRITREDAADFIAQRSARGEGMVRTETPAAYAVEGQTRKPLNSIRKRTAQHLARSWATVPHVLQAVEVDFMRVEDARNAAGAAWKTREGFALTYLPFIASAVAAALVKFPLLNASLDGDDLVLHRQINIGIAVDLNFEGLVVPVLKDAVNKSLPQLAREINDLARRARDNRLKPDDMTQATYTISNNGAFGTLMTAAIISPPQVAILSTDGVKKKPVVVESVAGDSVAIRPVGVLAQSFDHRAVDGAYSAAFLREVKAALETRDWTKALRA
ncbi:MAG TPA: dihydrolipoamide acetyltransferase family protein [Burkholderiales bacterium]|nr:dihydrolipoamide acetyltransferase family protein [Burkholderiales bacterium]